MAFMLNLTFLYFPPFGLPKSSIGAPWTLRQAHTLDLDAKMSICSGHGTLSCQTMRTHMPGAWISDWPNRHWALLAGVICGLGNTFQFMGAPPCALAACPVNP